MISPEAFLAGSELAATTYEWVLALVPDSAATVTKSQIAFRRPRAFAWLWRPKAYLGARGAEVVLSVALPRRDSSPRWKEVVRPSPRAWMHHLELNRPEELDAEAAGWLLEAAAAAVPTEAPAGTRVAGLRSGSVRRRGRD